MTNVLVYAYWDRQIKLAKCSHTLQNYHQNCHVRTSAILKTFAMHSSWPVTPVRVLHKQILGLDLVYNHQHFMQILNLSHSEKLARFSRSCTTHTHSFFAFVYFSDFWMKSRRAVEVSTYFTTDWKRFYIIGHSHYRYWVSTIKFYFAWKLRDLRIWNLIVVCSECERNCCKCKTRCRCLKN